MPSTRTEMKNLIEREYVVPIRKEWLKVPKHRRAARAVKALREFIARHMKVDERDAKKVKIDKWLNQEIWFRGIRKPPTKIRVKAKKNELGIVNLELVDIPEKVKWLIEKEKKLEIQSKKKKKEVKKKKQEKDKAAEKEGLEKKVLDEKSEGKEKTEKEKKAKEEKEKKEAVKEVGIRQADMRASELKHEIGGKKTQIQRKALEK